MPKPAVKRRLTEEQREKVEENVGLIGYAIGQLAKCRRMALSEKDLFQEGSIGLMYAAVGYKPSMGAFSTYAVRAITRHLVAAEMSEGTIRVPIYIQSTAFKGHRFRKHVDSRKPVFSLDSPDEIDAFHPTVPPKHEAGIEASEAGAAILEACSALTDFEKDVVNGAFVEGKTNYRMARDHGTSIYVVRRARDKAKMKLREKLQDYA